MVVCPWYESKWSEMYVWPPCLTPYLFAISMLSIKTLINFNASANVSKDMDQANLQLLLSHLLPLFLNLPLNFIHPLPCSLTNRVMQHARMFQGWQLWQPWVERWAIKGFSWHSWVSHFSLKWCENCESPAIIRILKGEKTNTGIEGRLVSNSRKICEGSEERNGERDGEIFERVGERREKAHGVKEQGTVMVKCINIQLACHAPHTGKKKTISQHYKPCLSPFVCFLKRGGAPRTLWWITDSWMKGRDRLGERV